MTDDTRAWTCPCGARGTFAFPSELGASRDDPPFHCPRCRTRLTDCRRTRRASRSEKPKVALPGEEAAEPLTDEDVERSAQEWDRTQEHVGKLGAMAESMWALDWADRLLAALAAAARTSERRTHQRSPLIRGKRMRRPVRAHPCCYDGSSVGGQ